MLKYIEAATYNFTFRSALKDILNIFQIRRCNHRSHVKRRQDQFLTLPHELLSEKNYFPVTSPVVTV